MTENMLLDPGDLAENIQQKSRNILIVYIFLFSQAKINVFQTPNHVHKRQIKIQILTQNGPVWNHRSLAPPGPLPHYFNTTILNDINGASGTTDHNDAWVACYFFGIFELFDLTAPAQML